MNCRACGGRKKACPVCQGREMEQCPEYVPFCNFLPECQAAGYSPTCQRPVGN